MTGRALGAILLALALAACGGGSPSGGSTASPAATATGGATATATTSPSAPAAAERYEDPRYGFTVDVPEGWLIAEDVPRAAVVALYPLAGAADAFAENVNVVVEELPTDLTASGYMDVAWGKLEPQLAQVELIGREELVVGGLPAASIEYRARFPQASTRMHLLQVAVLDGRTVFVVTYTGTEEFDRYRPDAEAIIASFSRP